MTGAILEPGSSDAYGRSVADEHASHETMTTLQTVPAPAPPASSTRALVAVPVAFADIPRAAWDRLFSATPVATPFSRWTYHRAWWDAYGSTAHEQYLCCVPAGSPADAAPSPDEIVAIVPLMHRHEIEPDDHLTATALRHATRELGGDVSPDAKAVFMGASYHTDYATILADPMDLPAVALAVAANLAQPPDPEHGHKAWDVVDLRRLRHDDPALDALEAAFRAVAPANGWEVTREIEDVCPVVELRGGDWEAYLGTLDKKARHEIRRKLRRAEAVGDVRFERLPPTPETVDAFIELHQKRWGAEGLYPDTPGGERSRRFLHRLAELEAAQGDASDLELGQVTVGGRVIVATVAFDDGLSCYFYNAGMDPDARDLSPGVTATAAYIRDRLSAGCRRFDFLRGAEPYKYEWGAVDELIHRLLVTRTAPG
jgi:CelD/BcsL family acetyltransferase involved in cellulose biosynthesis